MFVLVAGAGRVGSTVARRTLEQGHTVSVLDRDPLSHERLEQGMDGSWEDAGGILTIGAALESRALEAAGIAQADVFIAATHGDNTNLIIVQIAQKRYGLKRVIARVLDPARAEWYSERGGIEIICGTSRAIDMIEVATFQGIEGVG